MPPAPPANPGTTPTARRARTCASPRHRHAPLPPETKFGVFAGDVNDLAARPGAATRSTAAAPTQPSQPDPNTERIKAQAGVGIKGRSLDQYEGIVVTPVKAYFAGKERAFFDIEFPGNYRLWRIENEAPKDFDDLKAKFSRSARINRTPAKASGQSTSTSGTRQRKNCKSNGRDRVARRSSSGTSVAN